MKTRAELKEIAKKGFTSNYWPTVALFFVVVVLVGAIAAIPFAGGPLSLLIAVPLSVGLGYYFLLISLRKQASFSTAFKVSFSNSYPKYLGGSLWMSLWVFLWSLLFVIPGIVKAYAYAMTPYILADCPDVSATDALKVSMRIMDGHKFEFFVLELSFIGWELLSILGLFIPMFLYVGPYMQTTYAAYYKDLMDESIRKGIVTEEEIGTRLSLSVADAD